MRTASREPRCDEIVERIEALRVEKGITQRKMIEDLGLNSNSFMRWKYENSKSYMKYINQIADYLGVTAQYLLTGNDEILGTNLSDIETSLVKLFRKITIEQQEAVIKLLETMNPKKA
jgi:transcriptional regulator with XRE-family HTH domain